MLQNGISVLIAAQNEERLIQASVESYLGFADEIIVVTNGSTDRTPEICARLEKEYADVVRFFDRPEFPDLPQNRSFALSKARYRWIAKFDGDFVAYTAADGDLSLLHLRDRILRTPPVWPTLFELRLVNLYRTVGQCGIDREWRDRSNSTSERGKYIAPIYTKMPKIFLNTRFLTFRRVGRWEIVPHTRFYRKMRTRHPAIFHITLKSDEDLFRRSERTNWRELGHFDEYPTLDSYIRDFVLAKKYRCGYYEAIMRYIRDEVTPYLQDYDPNIHYPYPYVLTKLIDSGHFEKH